MQLANVKELIMSGFVLPESLPLGWWPMLQGRGVTQVNLNFLGTLLEMGRGLSPYSIDRAVL